MLAAGWRISPWRPLCLRIRPFRQCPWLRASLNSGRTSLSSTLRCRRPPSSTRLTRSTPPSNTMSSASNATALMFLPGDYKVDIPVGFYTEVIGLGASPDGVHIMGNVHSDASLPNNNATTTFWRAVEGFSLSPAGGAMQWAVSQAAPLRRMHIRGDIVLHQHAGWASGGWMSDALIDGKVEAGPQQQWISRNTEWGSWTGANWNMVFVGIPDPPAGEWPTPPYTKVAETPIVREKPFLQVDAAGNYYRLCSITAHSERRDHLASRDNPGKNSTHRPFLHRPARDGYCRHHQRAISQREESVTHARHL